MSMVKLPGEIIKLMDEVEKKTHKRPIGFNYDEWNSFEEYGEHLKTFLAEAEK